MLKRFAGVLIPLFSLRTSQDFGRGEIRGLVPMADLALAIGHRMIQLLPIDETAPGETSPYSAMSVLAIDPRYISACGLYGIEAGEIAAGRAAVGPEEPVDQIKLHSAKIKLLRKSFDRFVAHAGADERTAREEFEYRNREWLIDYSLFRALKEKYRWREWASWPDGLDRHEAGAVRIATRELAQEVAFYSYVQFVAHRQWQEVRVELGRRKIMLGGDLAFSPCRESAEVWANQEMFDLARTVGAPPDAFSKEGQRWGLPMPNWRRMRAGGFELIRRRVRHARELFELLRIDHVVGLFRTYSFGPDAEALGNFDPLAESDQRAQGEEIIRIVKREAGAMEVFAEDLGSVPAFVRASLKALGVPGYKVIRWEREWDVATQPFIKPAAYPELSVATTGTHDTDTMTEWWGAARADERKQFVTGLGLGGVVDVKRDTLSESAVEAIICALYSAPSRIAIAPVQDLFGWAARVNIPGTVSDANWKWRLPFALDGPQKSSKLIARIEALHAIAVRTHRV
jgi:4-alpha-glucanotransferase